MPLKLLAKSFLASTLASVGGFGTKAIAPVMLAIAATVTACGSETPPSFSTPTTTSAATTIAKAESLPLVVATNSVTCDLTKQIAGDTIALKCLIEAGTDPHVYQPKPEDRKAIDSAQLILYGGYELEPNPIKLIKASSNTAPKIAVNEVAVPSPLMSDEGHNHDREKEINRATKLDLQTKKEVDPHVWNNARNGIAIAQTIRKSLTSLRPDRAEVFAKNTAQLVGELEQIDTWIKSQIATIPESSRKLVTTHDALGYYAKAYGLTVEGALNGISTEEQPTPTRVKELVAAIKSSKVPTIFAEAAIDPKLIAAIAKEAKVRVSDRKLYADGLGAKDSEAESYSGMLIANTRAIVEGLGGNYAPFTLQAQ